MPIGSSAAAGQPASDASTISTSGARAVGTETPAAREGRWAVASLRAELLDDCCMEGKPWSAAVPLRRRMGNGRAAVEPPGRFVSARESDQSSNDAAGAAIHCAASILAPEAFQPTIPLA